MAVDVVYIARNSRCRLLSVPERGHDAVEEGKDEVVDAIAGPVGNGSFSMRSTIKFAIRRNGSSDAGLCRMNTGGRARQVAMVSSPAPEFLDRYVRGAIDRWMAGGKDGRMMDVVSSSEDEGDADEVPGGRPKGDAGLQGRQARRQRFVMDR